ncbi:MAG: GPW/gp25 family protein [Pyrinomonadaceae bacterium]
MDTTGFGFPFGINEFGRVSVQTGDEHIRAKIVQILLTAPGERVHAPEFGCGLRDLVFDPNNEILAATTEFTVQTALQRWLGEEILIEGVDITNEEATLVVEIVYLRRDRLQRGKVKITF